jgi:phospholipid N-methyltransferase
MRYWSLCQAFLRQFRTRYHDTGALLPSSPVLARALAAQLRTGTPPRRALEVGPGTGVVTEAILHLLRPGDHLDIVEINEHFVALLERRFAEEPLFRSRRGQTTLTHAPLQQLPGSGLYDYLISGLPLNNFAVPLVADIFAAYRRLLKPGGVLSYFEYLGIRDLKSLVVGAAERRRLRQLDALLGRAIRAHQFREQWVFLNVPPAVVRHLRFT